MKSIKFFFACVLALTFVACSNAESDSFEDNSSNFESMISLYGIQSATVDSKVGDVPSVTAEEMASVLEALRQNGNTIRNCESETLEGYYEGGDRKEVKMIAEYQARTRSGAFVEQFALCVSINFNIDNNGGVFYIGTTYSSSTDLFNWQGYGASLSTSRKANTRKRRDLRRCTSFENKPVSYPVITEVKDPALRMLLILHARQVVAESISRKQEKEKLNTLWEE